MQSGNADIADAFHMVAHDFRGDRRFLGHRQIAGAGADHRNEAWPLSSRSRFDGDAPGNLMVTRAAEFSAQNTGVFGRDSSDQNALLVGEQLRGDADDLDGRLARAKNHLRKAFAQRPVRIHLRKTKVGNGRGLKGAQHLIAARAAGAKSLEQLNRFGFCHISKMPEARGAVTQNCLGRRGPMQ